MNENELTQYKRVFITGANGFIGRALGELYRREGAEIRGIDFTADPEMGVVAGDITKPGDWKDQLDGCDLIIHTAAVVSNTASNDFAWQVNTLGTSQLLKLGVSKSVKRFVHVSSVAAYGFVIPEDVKEDYPVKANGNCYVDSKIAAEHAVLACHASGNMDCTIVRPTDVYGPGSRPWVTAPLEMIKAGQFMLPANGKSIFSPVYIDDLLTGMKLAAGLPSGAGQIFNLGGGLALTCEEFFSHHYRWLGK
ncbi:MAG: NAD(P)-dependent oxidoreductase, partial [Proteobacteria bacterium]|nr:NAD(P)-dependent oxidoreductase [Pseudomonadota bacterium]